MEKNQRNRMMYHKLPRNVENDLSAVHMARVWELLEEKFCFNIKKWKKEYVEYLQKRAHNVPEQEAFVDFGMEFINPVLNAVLKRDRYFDTWGNLLKYIVKKY
jgi:hypothetical protein